jgi:hypothetical protein
MADFWRGGENPPGWRSGSGFTARKGRVNPARAAAPCGLRGARFIQLRSRLSRCGAGDWARLRAARRRWRGERARVVATVTPAPAPRNRQHEGEGNQSKKETPGVHRSLRQFAGRPWAGRWTRAFVPRAATSCRLCTGGVQPTYLIFKCKAALRSRSLSLERNCCVFNRRRVIVRVTRDSQICEERERVAVVGITRACAD